MSLSSKSLLKLNLFRGLIIIVAHEQESKTKIKKVKKPKIGRKVVDVLKDIGIEEL